MNNSLLAMIGCGWDVMALHQFYDPFNLFILYFYFYVFHLLLYGMGMGVSYYLDVYERTCKKARSFIWHIIGFG